MPAAAKRDSFSSDFSPSKRRFAEFMLMATTFIWGGTFVVVKVGLESASPLFFAAVRFLAASVILTVIFFKKVQTIDSSALQKGVVLGILLCLGFAAQTIGLKFTSASKSGFITGMMVVFTPIMQFVIERQFPKLGNILGVGLVTIGLYVLTSPSGSEFNLGDGLTLVCAILFAVYIVYLDVVSKETNVFHLTYLQIVTTGVVSFVLAALFERIEFSPSNSLFFALGYLTLLATMLTTYVQTRFQRDTTPTRAAVIFSLEPLVAGILAYLFLNEIIGSLGILGGGIILAGILISELSDYIPLLNRGILRNREDGSKSSVP